MTGDARSTTAPAPESFSCWATVADSAGEAALLIRFS